ncbi:MAG: hypothetical protein Q4D85_12265 [Corynebacterium sp.]|uniref:hypothetical protein n=1 Tax=Corynebacterium sp. TaxID=1720 RepID=UPI0026DDB01C|nr:hypothetical protein [Corynebacterium sp.]MDO5099508.1 hypothetical protein [Corynebacterium sp.]
MNSLINPGTFILFAIIPALIYLVYYDFLKEKELKKKPFSGWHFLFEYLFFSALGQIIIFIIGVLFFHKYWENNLPSIVLFFITVNATEFALWLRIRGIFPQLPFRELKPFLREIMGKDPYPDPDCYTTTNAKPTRLFLGCSVSLIFLAIALIMQVVKWYRIV